MARDGDREAARKLKGRARDCAGYLLRQLKSGQTFRRQVFARPDGTVVDVRVWRDRLGERAVSMLFAPGAPDSDEPILMARYVWLPEGISITPRTPGAEKGFGLPKLNVDGEPIDPPWGTANGPLRECLLNRFPGNKYLPLDYDDAVYAYWPLAYTVTGAAETEFDLPGGYIGEELDAAQFGLRFDPLEAFYLEPEGESWVAHWVEEQDYQDGFGRRILRMTNDLRASVGRGPVYRPVRGLADPARMAVRSDLWDGYFGHESDTHPDGYETIEERVFKDGVSAVARENLGMQYGQGAQSEEARAESFFEGWRESAGHYANMVAADLDPDEDSGSAASLYAFWDSGEIRGETNDATGVKDDYATPKAADIAAQVFQARQRWLHCGAFSWAGDAGRLSWDMRYLHQDTNQYSSYIWRLGGESAPPEVDENERGYIYLYGRQYHAPPAMRCFGAGLTRRANDDYAEDGDLWVVCASLDRVGESLSFYRRRVSELNRVLWQRNETDGHDQEPWERYARFDLSGYIMLSLVRFSQNGRRAVFRVEQDAEAISAQCLPVGIGADFRTSVNYPEIYYPRRAREALFFEVTDTGETVAAGDTSGVALTVELGELGTAGNPESRAHTFRVKAIGSFPVCKDYVDNALVELRAEVDDEYFVERGHLRYDSESTLHPVPQSRTLRADRNLVFPSGLRVPYYTADIGQSGDPTTAYVTNAPSLVLSIDYLDLPTEDWAGFSIEYSTERSWDDYYASWFAKPESTTYALVDREGVLSAMVDPTREALGWSHQTDITSGMQVDAWVPLSTVVDRFGNHAFIPYPYSDRRYYVGETEIVNLGYVSVEEVVSYHQDILHGGSGSIQEIGGGTGLYNPMPCFGTLSDAGVARYRDERVAAAVSRGVTFTDLGGHYFPAKTWVGHRSTLDLKALTGLPDLSDDIFPIGLI